MKQFKYIVFFVILLILCSFQRFPPQSPGKQQHAVYIGYVQIDPSDRDKVAQIRIKVFNDDLQSAIKNTFREFQFTEPEQLCVSEESRLEAYFSAHLSIDINDQSGEMQLQDCLVKGEVTLLTMTMPCPANWQTIAVETDFFQELFPAQSNVFQVSYRGEQYFFRLNAENTRKNLSF